MELYLLRLLDNLDRSRVQPFVLVPGYRDAFRSSPQKFIDAVEASGVPLLRTPDPGAGRGLSQLRETKHTVSLLRAVGAGIVHIHTCRSEGANKITVAARLAGARVVRTEHFPPATLARRVTRYRIKPFDYITDYIVAGSDNDRREQLELLHRKPEKVIRSHNSVAVDALQRAPSGATSNFPLPPGLPVIGTTSRLVPQKDHAVLLDAFRLVLANFGPAHLLIVGEGDLRPELESQARALGIESYVTFAGHADDPLPYMRAMHVAAMPSRYEVFSLSMLEFMALGKPLVTSDHPSFLEAIKPGVHGLVVPTGDAAQLADALVRLLRDAPLREQMGAAARERARDFDISRLASDMMDLYDRTLSPPR